MKKMSIFLAAVALLLGLSQCKKQEQTTINDNIVPIILDVRANGGSRIDVNTANGVVRFETGDVVYVASGQKFVGTLTNNGVTFAGNLTNPTTGQPLYFFFLGNKTPEESLTAGISTTCSVNISDQTSGKLPVISFATSNETFTGAGLYTAFFLNKAALVKFDVTTLSTKPTCILGLNNKVTVDFSTNGFAYSQVDNGLVKLPGGGSVEHWAILLPQTASAEGDEGTVYTEDGDYIGKRPAISDIVANDYLAEGIAVMALSWSGSGHAYVDLGLPSGLLWATYNVGASTPEGYGNYFAWGETETKNTYNWSTYSYSGNEIRTLTKYCNNSYYGSNGFTDNLTTLLPEDDAATQIWGSNWRMPTKEEFQELFNNTTVTLKQQNGVNGRLFTANNGNSLFLPAAGFRDENNLTNVGANGLYWSSSLNTDDDPDRAWEFVLYITNVSIESDFRFYGQSVRAVRAASQN